MIIGLMGKSRSGKDTAADLLVQNKRFAKIGLADPLKRFCQSTFAFSYQQLWGESKFRNIPDKRFVRLSKAECAELFDDKIDEWHGGDVNDPTPLHEFLGLTFEEYADFVETGCVHLTPRFALQQLGTEWGRACYKNTWIDKALRDARCIDGQWEKSADLWGYLDYEGLVPWASSTHQHQGWVYPNSVVFNDVRFQNEVDGIHAAGGKVIRIVRGSSGLTGKAGLHSSETELDSIKPDSVIVNDFSLKDLAQGLDSAIEYWFESA